MGRMVRISLFSDFKRLCLANFELAGAQFWLMAFLFVFSGGEWTLGSVGIALPLLKEGIAPFSLCSFPLLIAPKLDFCLYLLILLAVDGVGLSLLILLILLRSGTAIGERPGNSSQIETNRSCTVPGRYNSCCWRHRALLYLRTFLQHSRALRCIHGPFLRRFLALQLMQMKLKSVCMIYS